MVNKIKYKTQLRGGRPKGMLNGQGRGRMHRVTTSLPPEVVHWLTTHAEDLNTNIPSLIREALYFYIDYQEQAAQMEEQEALEQHEQQRQRKTQYFAHPNLDTSDPRRIVYAASGSEVFCFLGLKTTHAPVDQRV